MASMKFMYEDLKLIICDEISMVGAMKLAKINYRLQDLVDGGRKQQLLTLVSKMTCRRPDFLVTKKMPTLDLKPDRRRQATMPLEAILRKKAPYATGLLTSEGSVYGP